MIVHRFMSDREYQCLMAGETLTNTTKHSEVGWRSTSIGFCFFTEPPEQAVHWMSFTVGSLDWCVTLDIPDHLLHKSRARYRDPENDSWINPCPASIWRTEWCLQEYSIGTVRVIKADDQWAHYEENMKKEVVNQLGPFGQLLLDMICPNKKNTES